MMFDGDDEDMIIGKSCDHCGRFGMRYEYMILPSWGTKHSVSATLCHADPDGKRSDPDCFTLVSQGGEVLGDQMLQEIEAEGDLDVPPWMKHEKGKGW